MLTGAPSRVVHGAPLRGNELQAKRLHALLPIGEMFRALDARNRAAACASSASSAPSASSIASVTTNTTRGPPCRSSHAGQTKGSRSSVKRRVYGGLEHDLSDESEGKGDWCNAEDDGDDDDDAYDDEERQSDIDFIASSGEEEAEDERYEEDHEGEGEEDEDEDEDEEEEQHQHGAMNKGQAECREGGGRGASTSSRKRKQTHATQKQSLLKQDQDKANGTRKYPKTTKHKQKKKKEKKKKKDKKHTRKPVVWRPMVARCGASSVSGSEGEREKAQEVQEGAARTFKKVPDFGKASGSTVGGFVLRACKDNLDNSRTDRNCRTTVRQSNGKA